MIVVYSCKGAVPDVHMETIGNQINILAIYLVANYHLYCTRVLENQASPTAHHHCHCW
jgi:hypothetical protein